MELLTIASLLEAQGHRVSLLDGRAQPELIEQLSAAGAESDMVIVTSSPMDRWECPNLDLESFKLWTDRVDPLKLILIGAHGTMAPTVMQKLIACRVIVHGEPEITIAELVRAGTPEGIDGLSYQESGRWHRNPDRPPVDLLNLPTPAYHLLDIDQYRFEVLGRRCVVFEATRGCPYSCSFCSLAMQGRRYRRKPIDQVVRDVEAAVFRLGAETAFFEDLEFTLDRQYTLDLCAAMESRRFPLRWSCQTRLDTVDPELLQAMKRAGCALILFGIESGSERMLQLGEKRLTHAQIRKGMTWTKEASIEQLGMFMIGLPGERDDEIQKTIDLAVELNPTFASFHVATPYPTTKLYELETGRQPSLTWGIDGLGLPEHFGSSDDLVRLRNWEAKAYRAYYLRPAYLWSRFRGSSPASWWRQWRLFSGYAS